MKYMYDSNVFTTGSMKQPTARYRSGKPGSFDSGIGKTINTIKAMEAPFTSTLL